MQKILGFVLASAALGTAHASPTVVPERHHIDNQELFSLRSLAPAAVTALEQGEELLRAGNVEGALDAFRKAAARAPESRLVARRKCQALALLGRRVEAMQACEKTLQLGATPLDFRASVLAITAGTGTPSAQELADAQLLASTAALRLPKEPWGMAAECDIVARLGDEEQLRTCTEQLASLAPEHEETRRARARLVPHHTRFWLGLGWGAMLAAGLGTLGHALRSRLGRAGVASTLALAASLSASPARAADPPHSAPAGATSAPAEQQAPGDSNYSIDDDNPVASVPSPAQRDADPLEYGYYLINLTNKAGAAENQKDYKAAVKFYLALAKAVPDEAVAFSKLCMLEEQLNEPVKAIEACRVAVTLHGATVGDYARFAKLIVSKRGAFTKEDEKGVRGLVEYLRSQGAAADVVRQVECPFALRAQDAGLLQQCADDFNKLDPQSQPAFTYKWAVVLQRGDFEAASRLLADAPKAGIARGDIAQMERVVHEARIAKWRHLLFDWKTGLGALLAVVLAGGWFVARSTKRTVKAPIRDGYGP